MPQWEETEPTSRPKRKMTQEQTDYNWNKHGRRNMGLRNTKTSYREVPNQDKFVLFFGNQSPFSQHHPATFTIDGTTFNCAEQYMMYQKTVIFENKEMERKIMETSNPVQQERYGRQIPEFKFEVWKKHFIEVVDRATEAKFSQNPHLLEHLVATYPKLLVEASPSDRLWGIGRCQKDPLAWDKETWRGKNQLGYIITRVRDRLMEVKDTHWEEWEKWKDDKRWEEEEAREKREKRRWESKPSDPYRGHHEERIPKTRRQGDGVHDGSMMPMKEDSMTSQSRRESYKHVSGKDNFEFFGGIKSPFSQHYPASFTIDGQTFTSAEQFTLYQMAVIFEDQECQKKIMSTSDPSEQERYTYDIPNFQWDVWEQKCVQVVERGITAKFTQNSELKRQLFATYPKLLAECKYDDDYWSTGYSLGLAKRKSEALDTNNWRGKNVLGYTLTAVRDRLMEMEKGQKELDVEDVRLQGTIEGDGAHLYRKILLEEEDRTGKEAAVGGEDGDIQQDVMTEKDDSKEANVEIRRSDVDVDKDERRPHREQDLRECWDSEEEEVTVAGSEIRGNEDADIKLAGDRNVMEQYQRARNSMGEEGNNGSVPVEEEDDGTEEECAVGLDRTEEGEGNVVEQQKLQKRIGEELKKEEEVTPGHADSTSGRDRNVMEQHQIARNSVGGGGNNGSVPVEGEDDWTGDEGRENYEFFCGIKSPFSQHYPASFTIDGQTFTSAEHFTLYQMAVIFEDQECQEKIMSTSDPKKQERYSRKIRNFRWDVWKQKRVQVAERAIIEKFSQNSDLKEQLFATSPKLLAECNYKDVFWSIGYGLGFAKTESEAWDTNKWRGWNVLGYTLTAVRDRLMDEKILIEEGDRTVEETAVGGEGTQQDSETRI